MSEKNNLPTIQEITQDIATYKKADELNFLLNRKPPEKWVKSHPFINKEITDENGRKIKVPYQYLPIERIEHLLRKVFKRFRIEVLREGALFNSVYCSVRVHYLDMTTNEWSFHDGVGAVQLQTKKGTGAGDLANINNGAVMMALPHAKTLAIKDACEMFGQLFGSDLNRLDNITYNLDAKLKTDDEKLEEIKMLFDQLQPDDMPVENMMHIERIIDSKETYNYDKVIKDLKNILENAKR